MMQEFTGRQYLKIDIANSYGLDKLTWDERLAWFDANETNLPNMLKQAEEPALFYAGLKAWEKAQHGQPSGYPISLDATCSGIQVLAALAGDRAAARLCNVVDTGRREDAYTGIYDAMVERLGESAKITRKQTKGAIMTAFYGSTREPKNVFGEGELLTTFYDVIKEQAPGAWEINEAMLAIWDPEVLEHTWVLPDNFHVKVKVMTQVKEVVHFLNEPFEVKYNLNLPQKQGRSLGANMVHSIDGMIVREIARRCMYDPSRINRLKLLLKMRTRKTRTDRSQDDMVLILWGHYLKTNFLSARILDYLDEDNFGLVPHQVLEGLIGILPETPFEVISVHDCFRVLPNHGNALRRQYNNLLAEVAESNLLSSIMSQMTGREIPITKLDNTLSRDIRLANYALS